MESQIYAERRQYHLQQMLQESYEQSLIPRESDLWAEPQQELQQECWQDWYGSHLDYKK